MVWNTQTETGYCNIQNALLATPLRKCIEQKNQRLLLHACFHKTIWFCEIWLYLVSWLHISFLPAHQVKFTIKIATFKCVTTQVSQNIDLSTALVEYGISIKITSS